MQNIGDRLTEARKRLGLDLRQASEATKIRTDYLTAMEDGSFDFSLPEVYKKGFLKIYARYLKLDSEKLASDFVTQFSAGLSTTGRRESPENLGRVEAPGGFGPGAASAFENLAADQAARAEKNAAMVRLVGVVAVAVVFIVGLIMVFQHMLQSSPPAADAKTADNTAAAGAASTPAPARATGTAAPASTTLAASAVPGVQQVVLAASGNISSLTVWQLSDNRQLFSGSLAKDKTQTVSSKGPVEISVSETQFLTIAVNGAAAHGIADKDGKRVAGPLVFVWPPQ